MEEMKATMNQVFTHAPTAQGVYSPQEFNRNTSRLIFNDIIKWTSSESITRKDLIDEISYHILRGLLVRPSVDMTESPIGLASLHGLLPEHTDDLYNIVFHLKLDDTCAAVPVPKSMQPPCVRTETFSKRVCPESPCVIDIKIDKDEYNMFKDIVQQAFKISEEKKLQERLLGIQEQPPDPRHIVRWAAKLNNFICLMESKQLFAKSSLVRGQQLNHLRYIKKCSQSTSALLWREVLTDSMHPEDWVIHTIDNVGTNLFGCNKHSGYLHKESSSPNSSLIKILGAFEHNTDNIPAVVMPTWLPRVEGSPFGERIDAIMFVPSNTRKLMTRLNMIRVARGVKLIQTVNSISLTLQDTSPQQAFSPAGAITLLNSGMFGSGEDNIFDKLPVESKHDLYYFEFEEKVYVVVGIEDSQLETDACRNIGLSQIAKLDMMVPTCGLIESDEEKYGLIPDETHFKNHDGVDYMLKLNQVSSLILKLMQRDVIRVNELVDQLPHGLKSAVIAGSNQAGVATYFNSAQAGFPFHHFDTDGTNLILNKYMIDNYYMQSNVVVHNAIKLFNARILGRNDLTKVRRLDLTYTDAFRRVIPNVVVKNEEGVNTTLHYFGDIPYSALEAPYPHHPGKRVREDYDGYKLFLLNKLLPCLGLTRNPISTLPSSLEDEKEVSKDFGLAELCLDVVLRLRNSDLNEELLNLLNPGFGVIWLSTSIVHSENAIICRVGGYWSIQTNPLMQVVDKSGDTNTVALRTSLHGTRTRFSLNSSSVISNHFSFIKQFNQQTDRILTDSADLMAYSQRLENLSFENYRPRNSLPNVQDRTPEGWIPIICPPFVDKRLFEGMNSPVGRLGTLYRTSKDHKNNFFDNTIPDVKYKTKFTINEIFRRPEFNVNVAMLYEKQVLEHGEFLLCKYLNFNPVAAGHLHAQMANYNRFQATQKKQNLQENVKDDMKNDGNESNISMLTGCAIPKYSYTKTQVLNWTDQLANPSGLKNRTVILDEKSHDWFINGDGTLDKFDQGGIPHSKYVY